MIGYANSTSSNRIVDCTHQQLIEALSSKRVADICRRIAQAREKRDCGGMTAQEFEALKSGLKRQLPVITPHATFAGGRRSNTAARPTGLCMYDKDHVPDPGAYWQQAAARLRQAGADSALALVHITPSCEGLRLVFVKPDGMTIPQAQQWMAAILGDDDYDTSVKDLARCSYLVPSHYVLVLNPKILFAPPDSLPHVKAAAPAAFPSALPAPAAAPAETCPPAAAPAAEAYGGMTDAPQAPQPASPAPATAPQAPASGFRRIDPAGPCYEGVPYTLIVDVWLRDTGGLPREGNRNCRLYDLAVHIRTICHDDPQLMASLMPPCGLGADEVAGIVASALRGNCHSVPRNMRTAIGEARSIMEALGIGIPEETPPDPSDYMAAPLPPAMPDRLPPLIALLVSNTPAEYRPAVAHAVFPPLAAHLCGVTFTYIDNVDHEATLMNLLMAGTGAGKNCVTEPINRIMADIRARDAESLRVEREWKAENSVKGANQNRTPRPDCIVVQEIDPDITNPGFIQRADESRGHFLYAHLNEVEQFDALRGSSHGVQHFLLMCLGFDPGNRYGQTRASAQAISAKVTVRFNWNASTTIDQGRDYFKDVLTRGPLTRINFSTIPEREIGAPMPVYGIYTDDFDRRLRPYIQRLVEAQGRIDCPEARALAYTLADECAEYARLSQSRTFENFSFRALVIAYLKACVLTVAAGGEWCDEMADFVRWSLRYDLWCKMRFFGADIDLKRKQAQGQGERKRQYGPRNLLTLLPDPFTREDVAVLRARRGLDPKGTAKMLNNWTARGYIVALPDGRYAKVKRDAPPAAQA